MENIPTDFVTVPDDEKVPSPVPSPVPVESVKLISPVPAEEMSREETKKCYKISKDAGKCVMCIVKSWSLCLNSVECICIGCSNSCLFCSTVCLGCNKCLEQMDCDGH